jgi:uncharacterized protein YraI
MRRPVIILLSVGFMLLLSVSLSLIGDVRAEFGTGWRAEFYSDTDLSDREATIENINGINFNWDNDQPEVNGEQIDVGPEDFSVRFTSNQNFAAGTYQFVVAADDGARVIIDGQTVLDEFRERPLTTNTFNLSLSAGSHSITVEHVQFEGRSSIQFQWFLQGATTGTVPANVTPGTPVPTTTTIPPLGATVNSSVRGLALRTGPYLGATLITSLAQGNLYPILGKSNDEGGAYTWYLLQAGTQTGWASGRYLTIQGDINSVGFVGSVFDQIDNAPDTGVVAAPRAVMNLRRRPSIRAEKIGSIPWGAQTQLIGRTVTGPNNNWLQVRYNGQVGWIYAPFVNIRGNQDAVPIR